MGVDWTEVITHPLGLTGYIISLVFIFLTRFATRSERLWLTPTFVFLALVVLLGGLLASYIDVKNIQNNGDCSATSGFMFGSSININCPTITPDKDLD